MRRPGPWPTSRIRLGDPRPKAIHRVLLRVEERLRKAIQEGTQPPDVVKELLENGILVGKRLALLDPRPSPECFTA